MTHETGDLRARLEGTLREAETRQRSRLEGRAHEMKALIERLDELDARVHTWLREVVVPRLATFASVFANAHPPLTLEGAGEACVELGATDEFPASAEVRISFARDPAAKQLCATFRARIIPALMPYTKEGEVTLEVRDEARAELERFVDDRLCTFAQEYLRIREPGSPYQADQTVVDPVCGMGVRRWEAAAAVRRGNETYYFCADECRQRFEAEPERYVRR